MKNKHKILLSVLAIILGWFFLGFGYATNLGHPISTICFLFGFVMLPTGIILFILGLSNSNGKIDSRKIYILENEKKSASWNRNLYELCRSKLKFTYKTKYEDSAFGSWYIEFNKTRLIYDGKDSCLILQNKVNANWIDDTTIKKDELNASNLFDLLDKL